MNMIRKASLMLAVVAMGTTGAVMTASPAAAASCYNRSGYSFKANYAENYNQIQAWRGSGCSGTLVARGVVTNMSVGRDRMRVYDEACDGVGAWGYVHGYSTHPSGCGENSYVDFNLSSVGNPHNWWLNIGGSVNSNAEALPA